MPGYFYDGLCEAPVEERASALHPRFFNQAGKLFRNVKKNRCAEL